MPNTRRLMEKGIYGELESTIPPITVPAWMCMMTSRDPGELGIYGFRNRKDYSYDALTIANSHAIKVPTLWDLLGQAQKKSVVLGVPLTYPAKPFPGWMVYQFSSHPTANSQWTFPRRLTREITQVASDYMIDIPNFSDRPTRRTGTTNSSKMTTERFQTCTLSARDKGLGLFHDG